jgi:hypothetical protein
MRAVRFAREEVEAPARKWIETSRDDHDDDDDLPPAA